MDDLDDDHPLWLVNEQIKGPLEGCGADEDHEDVLAFLRAIGLPEGTVSRMHKAAIPDGWQLVPKEPTSEMLTAGERESDNEEGTYATVFRAMLAAAPSATACTPRASAGIAPPGR